MFYVGREEKRSTRDNNNRTEKEKQMRKQRRKQRCLFNRILRRVGCFFLKNSGYCVPQELRECPTFTNNITLRMPKGKYKGEPLIKVPIKYIKWLDFHKKFKKAEFKPFRKVFVKLGILK